MSIAVNALLAVFNRKQKTVDGLNSLLKNVPEGIELKITLYDDGSTDGTSEDVQKLDTEIDVITGTGSAYWNGGMLDAWQRAAEHDPDFYLWLNDDTVLEQDALCRLLRTSALFADQAIVVGSTRDALTGRLSYGGGRRLSRLHPLRFKIVVPKDQPVPAQTMNGNCVLIPAAVYRRLGMLSSDFTHGMGDFDYGLRAREIGIEVWVTPGFIGTCSRNPMGGTWSDRSLSRQERWRKINSPKGLPFREWETFTRRHGGPAWLLFCLSPHIRILLGR